MMNEQALKKIMQELEKSGANSQEDINSFLKKYQGKNIDEIGKASNDKDRAQEMVYQAQEMPIIEGKKLIKKALKLDPENVDALKYLADVEENLDKALKMYEKAVKIAEKNLGKSFFKENKGYFWGLIETRPYMRVSADYARCLFMNGEVDKSLKIYEDLLELNPMDNQGIRYEISTALLRNKQLSKYESLIKKFEDEDCALWHYNNAIYHFIKTGDSKTSNKALLKAYKSNRHVLDFMLGIKELPHHPPSYIGRGDENEAVAYVYDTWKVWENIDGGFMWLINFKENRKNIN